MTTMQEQFSLLTDCRLRVEVTGRMLLLHCVSKNPDTCDIFKYLQQIMTNINNFWYRESSINVQSTDLKLPCEINGTGYQLSLFP